MSETKSRRISTSLPSIFRRFHGRLSLEKLILSLSLASIHSQELIQMGKRKTRSSQRNRRPSFPNAPLPPPSSSSPARRPREQQAAAQAPSRIGQRTEIPGFEYVLNITVTIHSTIPYNELKDPVRDRYFKVISASQGSAPPSQTTRTQSFMNEQMRIDQEQRHIQEMNSKISKQVRIYIRPMNRPKKLISNRTR